MNKVKTNAKPFRFVVRLSPLVAGIMLLLFHWNGQGEASRAHPDKPASVKSKNAIQKIQEETTFDEPTAPLDYRYQAPPGRVLEHDFNIRHEIVMRMPKNPMDISRGDVDPQTMNLSYKGRVVTAAYASPLEGRLLLGFEVARIEMTSDQDTTRRQRDLLSEQMKQEIFALVTPRGRFERLYFPAGMLPQTRNLAREIILRTQVILPENPAPEWKTMEEDATGLFNAEYVARRGMLQKDEILEVVRRKISYAAINTEQASGAGDIPMQLSGSTTAMIVLTGGWIRDMHSSEGLKAGGASFVARISKKSEAGLLFRKIWEDEERKNRTPEEMARILSGMDGSSPIGLENAGVEAWERHLDRLRALVLGRDFEEVLNEVLLPLLESGNLTGAERMQARKLLAALFELDSRQVADALTRMKAGTVPVPVMALIATAFGSAGTPASQAALVDLITDEQMDPKVRMPSLLAMASPKICTLVSRQALQDLVDPNDPRGLGVNTLLVLGAMTRNLNRFGGEGSGEMMEFLINQEGAFRDAGKTRVFLSALGNSADDRGFDPVCRYLDDPSETIRTGAVDALSNMSRKEVSGLLLDALEDEQDLVKVRAIQGLKRQSYTVSTGAAVKKQLVSSPSTHVRKTALRYFQKNAGKFPGAAEAIRESARNDPDEKVRNLAQQILARQ